MRSIMSNNRKLKNIVITVGFKSDKAGTQFTAVYTNPTTRKQITRSSAVLPDNTESINTTFKLINDRAIEAQKELQKSFPGIPVVIKRAKSGQEAIAIKRKAQAKRAARLGLPTSPQAVKQQQNRNEVEEHTTAFIERFGHIGKSRALLNAIVRHHGFDKLKEIHNEFTSIVADLEEEQKVIAQAEADKRLKAVKIYEAMQEQGLSIDDLADEKTVRLANLHKKQRLEEQAERNAKRYEFIEVGNSIPVKWDGNGTMPQCMQDHLAANPSARIEDFLV